jgi:hypothetical protein
MLGTPQRPLPFIERAFGALGALSSDEEHTDSELCLLARTAQARGLLLQLAASSAIHITRRSTLGL